MRPTEKHLREEIASSLREVQRRVELLLAWVEYPLQPDSGDGDSDPDGGTDSINLASIERPVLDSDFGD